MRILITGATGFIGGALCASLAARGQTLWALTRDPVTARQRAPMLERAFAWRPTIAAPPRESLEGVDAIVHLAGRTIAGRWNARMQRAIRESRVTGTANLVAGLRSAAARPRALICASATGYYGDRGEETLAEEAGPGRGFLADLCRDWEAEAARSRELGLRVVHLRLGLVLGPRGGALGPMLPLYRLGLGGRLGSGRQWWPWISLEDGIGLIVHALESDIDGPLNAVAPEPVRQRDFARALGRALQRPASLPAPGWALKLALGGFGRELLSSQRAVPHAALARGFCYRHSDLASLLTEILAR